MIEAPFSTDTKEQELGKDSIFDILASGLQSKLEEAELFTDQEAKATILENVKLVIKCLSIDDELLRSCLRMPFSGAPGKIDSVDQIFLEQIVRLIKVLNSTIENNDIRDYQGYRLEFLLPGDIVELSPEKIINIVAIFPTEKDWFNVAQDFQFSDKGFSLNLQHLSGRNFYDNPAFYTSAKEGVKKNDLVRQMFLPLNYFVVPVKDNYPKGT
jgi:hypothetical protein